MQKKRKLLIEITVLLLVALFFYTGLSKLIDFKGFTYDLNNQPFSDSLTPVLKWLVPVSEITIAAFLIFEGTRLMGLYASLILMSIFTIYTALVLLRVFEYVPCSCGGVIKYLTWPQHLVFNIFFVLMAYLAIRAYKIEENKRIEYQGT
ncbi:MauE/DoxX family redox-associated membrane protein [Pedobacter agri]|uniref:MauE/DoxX family redox-associated membrane protein n=1 Tax=Pedobacter agri TaxID=454586 RepID=UPI002930466D|nr:MauE/DoxX family redox-associated membrane protein [Pedobacter agri]